MRKKKFLLVTSIFEIPEVNLPKLKIPDSFWEVKNDKSKRKKSKR
jgi:hypothetical protein